MGEKENEEGLERDVGGLGGGFINKSGSMPVFSVFIMFKVLWKHSD